MNLFLLKKMMKSRTKIIYIKVFLSLTFSLLPFCMMSQNRYIEYLLMEGFKCSELRTLNELRQYTDNITKFTNEFAFLKYRGAILGVVYYKNDEPSFFITGEKYLTLFITDPMADIRKNRFGMMLYNFYSAYHFDFLEKKIYDIDFGLWDDPLKKINVDVNVINDSAYIKYTLIPNKKIEYPYFMEDTLISLKDYNPLKGLKFKKKKKSIKKGKVSEFSEFYKELIYNLFF
jgi:hypothetical protein